MASQKECVEEINSACESGDAREVVVAVGKLATCVDSPKAMQAGAECSPEECDDCTKALEEFGKKKPKMHGFSVPPELINLAIQFGIQLLTFLKNRPSA